MVSSLVLRLESGSRWNWEDVDIKEDFEDLELREKYGFQVGWYTIKDKIHILWRYVSGWETQIYLADAEGEASAVFRELVSEQLEGVEEEDKNKMLRVLEKYGGSSTSWLHR